LKRMYLGQERLYGRTTSLEMKAALRDPAKAQKFLVQGLGISAALAEEVFAYFLQPCKLTVNFQKTWG